MGGVEKLGIQSLQRDPEPLDKFFELGQHLYKEIGETRYSQLGRIFPVPVHNPLFKARRH